MSLLLSGRQEPLRVILLAARIYPSRTAGEKDWASAILSKPSCRLSGGRSAPTSTSRFSKSWIERAYSVWLSRWNERQPGLGCAAAALSIAVSREATKALTVSVSGHLAPGGGIM